MRVGVAALLSCGRQVGVVWGLALVLLSGIASAQQTINSTVLGPVYGNDNSITVTTSGTIDGISSGVGLISTGTNTTTTLTNAGTIVAYSRGVLNETTGSIGTITNSGTITANWAVANSGTIGTFNNQSGGSIVGSDYAFIADGGTITTLQNAGSVTGYNAFILANTAIGTFTNSGTAASVGGNGLRLGTGGSVGSFSRAIAR
jgi:mucin-19